MHQQALAGLAFPSFFVDILDNFDRPAQRKSS
jgi:hypothetical protein